MYCSQRLLTSGFIITLMFLTSSAMAQVASPPGGDNQRSKVCQWMGEVEVCITYNSPDVTLPSGKSRRGEIWGKLVPYGLYEQPWLEAEGEAPVAKPWRAGANENTVITFSHDVAVEGQLLKAGTYGLFFLVGEQTWELILSHDADKWGAYFYDEQQDALRVQVVPEPANYHEWLTYEFTNRKLDSTTLTLFWEDLKVPVRMNVPDVHQVYLDAMRKALSSHKIEYWYNWQEAAQYCLDNNVALEQGLAWAEKAIDQGWVGEANFNTLRTRAEILMALGRIQEGDSLLQFAIRYAGGVFDLHNYGRKLLSQDRIVEAQAVFKTNAGKHPDYWVAQLGLARGYAAAGDFKKATVYLNKAKALMPANELRIRKIAVEVLTEQVAKKETPVVYLAPGWVQVY